LRSSDNQEPSIEQSVIEANAGRRIHPGTKSADMAAGPPLVPLSEVSHPPTAANSMKADTSKLDSAFQLQEHLKALHYHYTKPSDSDNTIPINRESAILIASQPDGVDRALWLYELCRFLINKCNDLIIGFLFDDPPCSATTCPEMRASEWQFLCAVHESPKSCCAIDYCCHTLDWATNIVTSQKIFPSRLSLSSGDVMDERGAGVKHLINIFRRLHRIFAHAWFQHRGVFWQVEGQTGLYVLFKTVCDSYDLLPAENYKLPPEAEGLEPVDEAKAPIPAIMKSDVNNNLSAVEEDFISVGRANTNTRRHIRQSPSVGSAVHTVLESDEEDPDITQKLDDLNLADEEGEADVPVIVESYEVDESPEEKSNPMPPPPETIEKGEPQPAESEEAIPSAGSSWDSMSSDLEERAAATQYDDEKAKASEKPEETEPIEPFEPLPITSPKKEKAEQAAAEETSEPAEEPEPKEELKEETPEAKEPDEVEEKKTEE
jgi:hypothetical protein